MEARYSTIGVLDFRPIPSESLEGIPFEGCPLEAVCRRSASHLSESALRSAIIAYYTNGQCPFIVFRQEVILRSLGFGMQ